MYKKLYFLFFSFLCILCLPPQDALAQPAAKAAQHLSPADTKTIADALTQCWVVPPESAKLQSVTIHVELNPDASIKTVGLQGKAELKRYLVDVPYRLAALSAIEATKQCGPGIFARLKKEGYAQWKTIEPVFVIKQGLQPKPTPKPPSGPRESDLLDNANKLPPL